MLKIGIIGCGKMADNHALQICQIPGAELSAVCDREPLMARDMAERFGVEQWYSDIREMLDTANPDIVHITTPPQSHYELCRMCLEAGCHVYVEKPFTVTAGEALDLFALADEKKRKLIAGHNAQFTHAMIKMRELVQKGYLGGTPVHIESHYCYDWGDASYAKVALGDKDHWVRKLPGSLLQNIISHGVSKIAEFLSGEHPKVIAHGFTSPFLKEIGQDDIIDEVRVIIEDEDSTTAYFTFSSQIKPVPHKLRLFGPRNSLIVDDDNQVVIKESSNGYKSYVKYFIPPFFYAGQYIGNWGRNFGKFFARDFHLPNDYGLKTLISLFYDSILHDQAPPLSSREIILTARIMDQIFTQVRKTNNRDGIDPD